MEKFFHEDIADFFNTGLMSVAKADFVRMPVTTLSLKRNDDLDLIFEFTSPGWVKEQPERYGAGTVRSADEIIEFRHAGGWGGVARGVVSYGFHGKSDRHGKSETYETYSAHSVELNFPNKDQPAYVVEWVANIPGGFVWTEPTRLKIIETFEEAIGTGDGEVLMKGSAESGGGSRALHLKILDVNLYVMKSGEKDESISDAGQIVYQGCPSQAFRDKVRTCISFILGKPIVYLGHTEYSDQWIPVFMRSVDAFTAGGAVFRLHDLPPYPINDSRYANIVDQTRIAQMVNALFDHFDLIKFNELSWSYWYAMCAPLHAAAIHFGSLIEQLQKNVQPGNPTTHGKLLDDKAWRSLNQAIAIWLATADIPSEIEPILRGKIASLNQAPVSVLMERLLDSINLKTGAAEKKAWKDRNLAAHGGFSDNPIELILNSKILRLLFHRILAGITKCANQYVDYYSLGHPVRPLTDAVPERPS